MLQRLVRIAALAACVALPPSAWAQDEPSYPLPSLSEEEQASYQWPEALPDPEAVFERHMRAAGGERVFRRREGRFLRGSMSNNTTGFRAILTAYQQAPNRLVVDMNQPGATRQRITFDGRYAWLEFDGRNPTLLGGPTLRDLAFSSFFYRIADWKDRFGQVQTRDFAFVAGRPCVRIAFISPFGKLGFVCFDIESGLHHATLSRGVEEPDDSANITETLILSYELHDGMLIPMQVMQSSSNGEVKTSYTSVEHDPENMPGFERPEPIQAQIDQIEAERSSEADDGAG
ncbi:MAG: hypothetical protein AAGB51_09435 [Planctomycetota bacterium]